MEIITEDTIAVIVAIEDYQFSDGRTGINSVDYAKNDAIAFKELLIEEFGVSEKNIIIRLDDDATKTWFENELPYEIRNLEEDERFIFYYAGHGFYQGGTNRLTTWDSHSANLQGTTVSLKEVLLSPIEESECQQSLIFIDACAIKLPKKAMARDLISNMDKSEFLDFIKDSSYSAIFTSCSPGEKSYPSPILKHGIWTWHLIEALAGKAEDAIARDNCITDASLRDYLKYIIPKYITKNTKIRSKQTPYAVISSSGSFGIRIIPEDETESTDLPELELEYDGFYLRGEETDSISSLPGFDKKKRHFVPSEVNEFADSFVKRLLDDDLRDEIKGVYNNTKKVLKLKRKDIEKWAGDGSGGVENEYFRYFIDVEQNPDDCEEALTTRKLILRTQPSELPDDFDNIFPADLDEIVIPISGTIDFDDLVERFENFEDAFGGNLEEDEDKGLIGYATSDGQLSITIQTYEKKLIIYPRGSRGCLDLIAKASKGLQQIVGGSRKLLK